MTKFARTGELAILRSTVRDVADRMSRLPETRLRTRAESGLELAQHLADAAAGIAARAAAAAPPWREVPRLSIFAVGDQVAVTGADLCATADGLDGATTVWHVGERRSLGEVLTYLQARAADVRAGL